MRTLVTVIIVVVAIVVLLSVLRSCKKFELKQSSDEDKTKVQMEIKKEKPEHV